MWHTLPEAVKLTGRSRRSLYRDMDAGRVSYRVGDDGRREMETAELIRAYGALAQVAQPNAPEVAHSVTPPGTLSVDALQPLLDELKALREEVKELRQTMLLIEHKPQPKGYDGREGFEPSSRPPERSGTPRQAGGMQPPSGQRVNSFADILARFNSRTTETTEPERPEDSEKT